MSERNKFKKGNPGKPKGAISNKTKQWEALSESIVTTHAERFNTCLASMDDEQFSNLFIKVLEFFKPKYNRTEIAADVDITTNTEPIKVEVVHVNKDNS